MISFAFSFMNVFRNQHELEHHTVTAKWIDWSWTRHKTCTIAVFAIAMTKNNGLSSESNALIHLRGEKTLSHGRSLASGSFLLCHKQKLNEPNMCQNTYVNKKRADARRRKYIAPFQVLGELVSQCSYARRWTATTENWIITCGSQKVIDIYSKAVNRLVSCSHKRKWKEHRTWHCIYRLRLAFVRRSCIF